MPTFEVEERFRQAYQRLHVQKKAAFLKARDDLVAWLVAKKKQPDLVPPAPLRLHFIESKDAWSITFGGDQRALWRYGEEVLPGEVHIIWERIDGHDIY
ncbi:MAG TPA: hypothetical protein VH599_04780 [Ktedonobacterales bacterium]|jgi:hypothetical protein